MISLRSTYLTCALLALSAVPAFCTAVQYGDRATWMAAVTSPSTVTFDSDPVQHYDTTTGFTTGLSLPDDPTFLGMESIGTGWTYNLQIVAGTRSYNYGSGNSLIWGANNASPLISTFLLVTWPTPVTAVGLDFMTWAPGLKYNATINGDNSLVYTTTPTPGIPNSAFFGLTSDTPINSIDFYLPITSNATPLIDNFSYGSATAPQVPEPRSFLLIASGLIGLALMGRRVTRPATKVS